MTRSPRRSSVSPDRTISDVEIVPFRSEHRAAFDRLNRAWLVESDLYEPPDEPHLSDPEGSILGVGGAIFIALRGGEVVGTAATIPHGDGEIEIVKLTVSERARAGGVGRRLVERCLMHGRLTSMQRVVLVSSTKLAPALRLYESMGFVRRPLPDSVPYASADVFMDLRLTTSAPPPGSASPTSPPRP